MNGNSSQAQAQARKIADLFSEFPQVQAVALAGSQTAGMFDGASDIDLYVYTIAEIPFRQRAALWYSVTGYHTAPGRSIPPKYTDLPENISNDDLPSHPGLGNIFVTYSTAHTISLASQKGGR